MVPQNPSDTNTKIPGGSEVPEPIFENVVAEQYPDAYQASLQPEEVPAEISTAQEVDRPASAILNEVPVVPHDDGKQKYLFIGIVVVIFFAIFFGLLFLFRGRASDVKVPATLTYWGTWEDEAILKPVFDAYTKANPHIKIVYAKQAPREYIQYFKGRAKSGLGPDIIRFHNTWLPQFQYPDKYLVPLPPDVMAAKEYQDTFYPSQVQDLQIGSSYYGIPLYVDNLVMIYNEDLLKAAGYSAPPTLWNADLMDMALNMTVKGVDGLPQTAGVALGTANNIEHFSDIFTVLLLVNNLTKQSDLSNLWAKGVLLNLITTRNTSSASESLHVYRQFAEDKMWSSAMPKSVDAFAQGKVGIIFAYTWQIPIIMAKNPDLNFKVARMPAGPQDSKLTLSSYWVEGVSAYSKNPLESWKLLKYMAQPENLEKIYAAQTKSRGLGMAYPRVDMKSKLASHPQLSVVVEQAAYSVSLPVVTRTFDKGLNDEMVTYIENAINTAANGGSYSSAIEAAIPGFQQVLTKYGIMTAPTPTPTP